MAARSCEIISLASGIGGLDLGVHRALRRLGIRPRTICMVERGVEAAQVLAKRMEEGNLDSCPIWTDIETFPSEQWRGLVDGVVAGIPCQPHSHAGDRKGVDDERHLWPYVQRILKQTGARWFFLENVDGLRSSSGGEAFGEILQGLAAVGFTRLEWVVLGADDIGAPHRRKRIFLLASRVMADQQGWKGGPSDDAQAREPHAGSSSRQLAHSDGYGLGGIRVGQVWNGIRKASRNDADGQGEDVADSKGVAKRESGDEGQSSSSSRVTRKEVGGGSSGMADRGSTGLEGRESLYGDAREEREAAQRDGGGQATAISSGFPGRFPPGPTDHVAWLAILPTRPDLVPAAPTPDATVHRMAHGPTAGLVELHERRAERLKSLGNAVVPDQAEAAFIILWEAIHHVSA